jgi:hypothetical protein
MFLSQVFNCGVRIACVVFRMSGAKQLSRGTNPCLGQEIRLGPDQDGTDSLDQSQSQMAGWMQGYRNDRFIPFWGLSRRLCDSFGLFIKTNHFHQVPGFSGSDVS